MIWHRVHSSSRRFRQLLARRILQQLSVDVIDGQLNVSDDTAADEAVLHGQLQANDDERQEMNAYHVRIFRRIGDADVVQLDVEVLVDRVQSATDAAGA